MSVTEAVFTQPFASVTVTVYDPAQRLLIPGVVSPFGSHAYEYGGVPPETTAAAAPLQTALQEICVALIETLSGFGCVMVTV